MSDSWLFMLAADGTHERFIGPYVVAVLSTFPDARVEIIVPDVGHVFRKQTELYEFLDVEFGDRVLLRQPAEHTKHVCAMDVRWLDPPLLQADYTYTGDIDILIVDDQLQNIHKNNMRLLEQCYSNRIREGQKRLTGLHCVRNADYFPAVAEEQRRLASIWEMWKGSRSEFLLYDLVEKTLGLPQLGVLRPLHGPHLSVGRNPHGGQKTRQRQDPGWGGVNNANYMSRYRDLTEKDIWKQAFPLFPPEYRAMIDQLEEIGKEVGTLPAADG